MKIAYFDCSAGAAGDMIVASLLDAGLNFKLLKAKLAKLNVQGLSISTKETKRAGMRGLQFICKPVKQTRPRGLKEICRLIDSSDISPAAKKLSIKIFKALAAAEAKVHGTRVEEVHFHEIGAVDSIADIVGAAVGLDALGIEKVYCSPLSLGGGSVKCRHSEIPVPSPATLELIKGIAVRGTKARMELLTPTGAAILTAITSEFGPVPEMKIESTGCGAGSRECEGFPNILRLFVGEVVETANAEVDSVCLLETNIDDVSGEVIGFAVEKLLAGGALDVYTTGIYMKQNRPGVTLSVLCEIKDIERMEEMIFGEGISFGIRKQILQRRKLSRHFETVKTDFGKIRMKVGMSGGKVAAVKPEFKDCVEAAKKSGVAVKKVMEEAMRSYRGQSGKVTKGGLAGYGPGISDLIII